MYSYTTWECRDTVSVLRLDKPAAVYVSNWGDLLLGGERYNKQKFSFLPFFPHKISIFGLILPDYFENYFRIMRQFLHLNSWHWQSQFLGDLKEKSNGIPKTTDTIFHLRPQCTSVNGVAAEMSLANRFEQNPEKWRFSLNLVLFM